MCGIKFITWVVSLSIVGGAVTTAPASAQLNHAVTATDVSNSSAVQYGFQPLINTPSSAVAIEGMQNAITPLANDEEISNAINSFTKAEDIGAQDGEISADTRTSLLALSERLSEINRGLWKDEGELDQNIRGSAAGLSRDLADAEASCRADASNCARLNSLVGKINAFVKNLETLRTTLERNGQEARIF